ncbi:MAG: hypothetical protein WA633_06650, partial [Stellaceae bacterium]
PVRLCDRGGDPDRRRVGAGIVGWPVAPLGLQRAHPAIEAKLRLYKKHTFGLYRDRERPGF